MGIQFPPIAFLYLLYFCIYIFFYTLVRSFIKLLNLNYCRVLGSLLTKCINGGQNVFFCLCANETH